MKKAADTRGSSGPVSIYPLGKGNALFLIAPYLVTLILDAFKTFSNQQSDGIIAGKLPTCSGSTFPAFCTERVAKTASANTYWEGQWHFVSTPPLTVPAEFESTFDRLMMYVNDTGIWLDEQE